MKITASFLSVVLLSAAALSANASPINPISDGYVLSVNGQSLTTNNLVTDLNLGAPVNSFVFSDGLTQYVFLETSAANAVAALSVTEFCATVNLAPCKSSIISVSNANVGAISLSANVNASLSAAANANAGVITLAAVANLGSDSATVAFAALPNAGSGNSPVPEPGTMALVATGVLGAAGSLRRRSIA